ncbi:hypothetical protein Hanom_Chr08g00693931 [Helianthus anomalus]
MFDEMGDETVSACRRGERRKVRERVLWGGVIPISTNHTFFFKSLPLHQMSKPLPTFFTKV